MIRLSRTSISMATALLLTAGLLATVSVCLLLPWSSEPDYEPHPEVWSGVLRQANARHAPRWTADGAYIVVPHRGFVFVVRSDGSRAWQASVGKEGEYDVAYSPDISPDGSHIVYATTRHPIRKVEWSRSLHYSFDIETVALDGSNPRKLTANTLSDFSPAWSPDGSRIAFARDGNIGNSEDVGLYVMDSDGSSERMIVDFRWHDPGEVLGAVSPQSIEWGPVWSPDGDTLAYVVQEAFIDEDGPTRGRRTLYTVQEDGSTPRELFARVLRSLEQHEDRVPTETVGPPAWSPNGERLAFSLYVYEHDQVVYNVPDASGNLRNVTQPGWVRATLYTIGADGADLRELAAFDDRRGGTIGYVEWSPDDGSILFSLVHGATPGDGEIYVINADGSDLRFIGYGKDVSWSPDGSRIANRNHFDFQERRWIALSTMAPDGSDVRIIAEFDQFGRPAAAKTAR